MSYKKAEAQMEEEDETIVKTTTYLREVAEGRGKGDVENLILHGLELVHVGRGLLRCNLRITEGVSDGDGKWEVGAMAAVMDTIGITSIYSKDRELFATVDFNSSFYSTAKIHEEVEIEAKVVGRNGRMKSAKVEIRRKGNGDLMATGALWMSPITLNLKHKASDLISKL